MSFVLILILVGLAFIALSWLKSMTVVHCEPEGCVFPPFYYFWSFWIGLVLVVIGAVVAGAVIFSRLLPVEIGNVIEVENEEQAIIAGKFIEDLAIAMVAVVVGCVAAVVGLLGLSAWWKRKR